MEVCMEVFDEISFSLAKHIPFQRRRRLNPEDEFFWDANFHRIERSKIRSVCLLL